MCVKCTPYARTHVSDEFPLAINQTFNKSRATKKRVHYFDCRSGQAQKWKHAASVVHKLAQRNHTHTHTQVTKSHGYESSEIWKLHRYTATVNDLWELFEFFIWGLRRKTRPNETRTFCRLLSLSIGFWNSFKMMFKGQAKRERELNNFENVACWRLFSSRSHLSLSIFHLAGGAYARFEISIFQPLPPPCPSTNKCYGA